MRSMQTLPAVPANSLAGNGFVPPQRVSTWVRATDPLLAAGIVAGLRQQPGVRLRDDPMDAPDLDGEFRVAIVAGDQVDEELLRIVRTTLRNGCPKVVLIAGRLDDASVFTALEAGVCGMLRREGVTPDELARAVQSAANGHGSMPPDVLGRVLNQVGRMQRQVLSPRGWTMSPLRKREIDVLRLLAEGADTAEIASELEYSERTIKSIIHDVTVRFGLRNRTHAVAYAVREGLI
jgi:DNA-binding NarL/FixJ family response regulator